MRRTQLPDHLIRRTFTTKTADAAGVSDGRTRAKDLIRVSRGILVPAGVPLQGAAALAAYTEANPVSVVSHVSAARLWGIPLSPRQQGDWRIHLANPLTNFAPRRVNVVGHRLAFARGEIWKLDGVRLTGAARTWLDLAALLSWEELVAAGDFLVCSHGAESPVPRQCLCSIDDLARIAASHHGYRGLRYARAALGVIRVGADSPPESAMRLALVAAGLPEPELNTVVRDAEGWPQLWPDGAYPRDSISLQYDGNHHNANDQYLRDMRGLETTKTLSWEEIRLGGAAELQGRAPYFSPDLRHRCKVA